MSLPSRRHRVGEDASWLMGAPGELIVGWALLGLPGLGSEAALQQQQGCLPACRLDALAKAQL